MKRTILRLVIIAATVTCASGMALVPAQATPKPSVSSLKQCGSSSCANTSSLTVTTNPDSAPLVHDSIQIAATATTNGILESLKWVRVSVRDKSSDPFTCLIQWAASGSSFSPHTVIWDTSKLPQQSNAPGCPSSSAYGTITSNGALEIQVSALSNQTSSPVTSTPIWVKLNNAPTTPSWAADPAASGTASHAPVVTLSWNADPEPDVNEYHFIRQDPGSSNAKEYAVSASSPGDQGCQFSSGVYTCFDSDFPTSGFGGTYSYWLVAYRLSPSSADHCSNGTNCIQSPVSEQRAVSMTEPTPSPSSGPSSGPTATPGGTNLGARPGSVASTGGSSSAPAGENPAPEVLSNRVNQDTFCFTCGSYKKTLPYGGGSFGSLPGDGGTPGGIPSPNGQNPVLAAGSPLGAGGTGTDPRQLWSSVAAGLVLLLTAAHVARILRATAH